MGPVTWVNALWRGGSFGREDKLSALALSFSGQYPAMNHARKAFRVMPWEGRRDQGSARERSIQPNATLAERRPEPAAMGENETPTGGKGVGRKSARKDKSTQPPLTLFNSTLSARIRANFAVFARRDTLRSPSPPPTLPKPSLVPLPDQLVSEISIL